ncbi:MAG TPA: cell division protein ZipA C-terminal FtsZ-binding domain-containing protein [Steroidobacteraceae bacterium]|nr:cell division protein ZipA C-terminal FtsZ-binding domain-containing protein [Steroidobacteraceae bacterium]
MSELRWWLLILGVLFFVGLTLFELRRPRQARRRAAPPEPTRAHEPPLQLPEMRALEPLGTATLPLVELPEDTATFPVLEAAALPETPAQPPASAAPAELEAEERAALASAAQEAAPVEANSDVSPEGAPSDEPSASAEDGPRVEWPPDDQRRVVALRLVAPQPERFAGRSLRQALAAEGFVLGRFDIFHKPDDEWRAVVSAASLTRPGTFDAETMDSQHFGGLSLFAVLPGPKSPPQAFEELVTTARNLNDRLCGVLQDEGGTPLTPARIASLRERLSSGTLA